MGFKDRALFEQRQSDNGKDNQFIYVEERFTHCINKHHVGQDTAETEKIFQMYTVEQNYMEA